MQEKIFLALLETSASHWNISRKGFQKMNLSDGQPKVLYILNFNEGLVQKKLAEICQIKPSTMTVLLTRMESQGYVRREKVQVSGGKRAYAVYLTETGKALANELIQFVDELETISFHGFSQKERELLFSLLGRIKKNLDQQSLKEL